MEIFWLEQTGADVPPGNNWLSANEAAFFDSLRFPQRRSSWRLGRWTAKRALAARWNLPPSPESLAKIEVRPAPSGAPEVFFENASAHAAISLSHRNDRALCFVGPSGADLGCDLELIEPRSDAFVSDYFISEEREMVGQRSAEDRPAILALLWSAKESALKALRVGLRLDTRSMIVGPLDASAGDDGWCALRVRHTDGQVFDGWWRNAGGMVRTVVTAPPPMAPIAIKTAAYAVNAASPTTPSGADPPMHSQPGWGRL